MNILHVCERDRKYRAARVFRGDKWHVWTLTSKQAKELDALDVVKLFNERRDDGISLVRPRFAMPPRRGPAAEPRVDAAFSA